MKAISISDITLKQKNASHLTFREKLELVKYLDRLCVDVIETDCISNSNVDVLSIKSYAQTAKFSTIAVPVNLNEESIELTWGALKGAKKPRLKVAAPVSTVQMEYIYHEKASGMKSRILETVKACSALCGDVEFEAIDATRSEITFLCDVLNECIKAGATTLTVTDSAGNMLPDEFKAFMKAIKANVELPEGVTLAVSCSNKLSAAEVLSIIGVMEGAGEVKASAHTENGASLSKLINIIDVKGDEYGIGSNVKIVEFKRVIAQVKKLFTETKSKNSPFEDGVRDSRDDSVFTVNDGAEVIEKEIVRLGYDLSEEDLAKVFEQFKRIAEKKEKVTSKELDAIVASTALQVPPTYRIEDYIINSGHLISATSHIILSRDGEKLEGLSLGDGAVDASFLAIEQITGQHYELDDFQVQAVTEGREAMGETIVKLRAGGKLYSGRGLSTDVVGSSIRAYINALNKIVYENNN